MSCQISNQEVILDSVFIIIICVIVVAVGVVAMHLKGDQATCTTTKLSSSSFVVCTYNDKILYSGEVKE